MERTVGFYWQPGVEASGAPLSTDDAVERQLDLITAAAANTVFVPHQALTAPLIRQARARNIRLIVDWRVFAGEDLRQRYPDSVPIDADGAPLTRDGWYVPACPNHPQLRAQHLDSIQTLLTAHGEEIAGLWLDFIRFPARWETAQPRLRQTCFCTRCLNHFLHTEREHFSEAEMREQAAAILRQRREEWIAWKCERIVEFVRAVRRLIAASGLNTELGIFSVPWRRAEHDGALRAVVGQDLGRLAEVVDCFSPMVYHKLCEQPPSWVAAVTHDVLAWTRSPVLPIIQSFDRPDKLSAQELEAALAYALAAATRGVMIFTLAPLLDAPEKRIVVTRAFRGESTGRG